MNRDTPDGKNSAWNPVTVKPPPKDLAKRRADDFKFMVLCQRKNDMAMYDLMRDKSLDQWKDIKT